MVNCKHSHQILKRVIEIRGLMDFVASRSDIVKLSLLENQDISQGWMILVQHSVAMTKTQWLGQLQW